MNGNLVITIGRQCGSKGMLVGQKLAEAMGVKCYDKELLTEAAKHSGLSEELFETHDEKPTNSFLYSLVMDTYSMGYNSSAYPERFSIWQVWKSLTSSLPSTRMRQLRSLT